MAKYSVDIVRVVPPYDPQCVVIVEAEDQDEAKEKALGWYMSQYSLIAEEGVVTAEELDEDIPIHDATYFVSSKGDPHRQKGPGSPVGKTIRIDAMAGEPQYSGKVGTVEYVDDEGQLHGTWGGAAVIPGEDLYTVL